MAEVTGLRNNALPYPVYGAPWGVTFPILDADGDPVTGATGLDSEVSKNGDTFADCTNEATEIATSSGIYYLLLTAAEMTADVVTVQVKTTSSGAKTTVLTFYPRKLVTLRTGTCQGGAAGYMTLDASAGSRNDRWNGCLVVGVLDSTTEARVITDYDGSNQQASVTPNWNTTPDSDDTFTIYLPEGMQLPTVNVSHVNETAQTAGDLAALINAVDDYVDSEVAAIKAKTDNLPSDPADASDIAASFASIASTLATIAAYIDTEVAAIKAKTDNLPAAPAATGDIPTAAQNAAALMDLADGIETSITPRQALRLILASAAGKLSGAATTTITIRNVGDSKDRITATVDADGNRSAVTVDGT